MASAVTAAKTNIRLLLDEKLESHSRLNIKEKLYGQKIHVPIHSSLLSKVNRMRSSLKSNSMLWET